jgi:hypothetical protein
MKRRGEKKTGRQNAFTISVSEFISTTFVLERLFLRISQHLPKLRY